MRDDFEVLHLVRDKGEHREGGRPARRRQDGGDASVGVAGRWGRNEQRATLQQAKAVERELPNRDSSDDVAGVVGSGLPGASQGFGNHTILEREFARSLLQTQTESRKDSWLCFRSITLLRVRVLLAVFV